MPATDMKGVRIRSNAFGFWKDKEKQEGGRITIDTIADSTGLAKMTVRRFLDADADVSGSTLGAAAILAGYLGTDLGGLLTVELPREVAP